MLLLWMGCYPSLNKKCLLLADFYQDFYFQVQFDILPRLTPLSLAAHHGSLSATSMFQILILCACGRLYDS